MPSSAIKRRQVNKTADYTIKPDQDRPDTLFTTFGATGTVIFTLPAPTVRLQGTRYEFISGANYTVTVATATADTALALNDASADSVSVQTSSQMLGARIVATCVANATSFQWQLDCVTNGATGTIAT